MGRLIGFVVVLSAAVATPAARRQSGVSDALTLYAAGQYDTGLARLTSVGSRPLAQMRDDIRAAGTAWLDGQPEAIIRERSLSFLAFVLEFAQEVYVAIQRRHGLLPTDVPPPDEVEAAWDELRPLVEYACDRVRAQPSVPGEAAVWRVSLDVFRLFRDSDVVPFEGVLERIDVNAAHGHLAHVLARLPGSPMVRLAQAERVLRLEGGTVNTRPEMPRAEARARAGRRNTRDIGLAKLLMKQAAAEPLLESIAETPDEGPAASLHLGSIALSFGEHDRARHYYQAAGATAQPRLRYLAYELLGLVEERSGDMKRAETAYREALEVVPRAQSASSVLAALLWTGGRLSAAQAIATEAVPVGASVAPDPWSAYCRTGYWSDAPTFTAEMRAVLPGGR